MALGLANAYRLRYEVSAFDLQNSGRMKFLTLGAGSIVRVIGMQDSSLGEMLVQVECEGQLRAVFVRDLQTRAHRIRSSSK